METYIIVIQILTLIGLFIIYRTTRGYADQKGKNLADKEDLKQLTNLVEEVKTDFNKDLKRFEGQLKLMNDLRLSHMAEARKSIIDFHAECDRWIAKLLGLTAEKVKLLSPEELRRASESLEKVDQAYLSLSTMQLLNDDEQLYSLGLELMRDIVKFSDYVREKVNRIGAEKSYIEHERSRILGLSETDPSYQAQKRIYVGVESSTYQTIREVLKDFPAETKSLQRKCANTTNSFVSYVRPILAANSSA